MTVTVGHDSSKTRKTLSAGGASVAYYSIPAAEAAAIHAAVTSDVLAALTVEASVASRTSYGGTAPERVRQAIAAARAALEGSN